MATPVASWLVVVQERRPVLGTPARVDEVLCAGCGACVDLYPRDAIHLEEVE